MAGARYQGERHRALQQPCCDALYQWQGQGPVNGFVICDGAGGDAAVAQAAALGARAAWRALNAVQRERERALRRRTIPAKQLLQQRFAGAFWGAYGTRPSRDHTVLACLWTHHQLLIAQLGDSTVLVKRQGQWQLPIAPTKGAYANETSFLRRSTPADAIGLWWCDLHQVEGLLGFSDGLEAAFLAPRPDSPEQLQPHQALAELVLTQQRLRFGARSYGDWLQRSLADEGLQALSDDDRTLVVVSR